MLPHVKEQRTPRHKAKITPHRRTKKLSEMEETKYQAENGEPRALFKAEYKAILCKRNTSPESGWHLNTEEHGEAEHIVRRYIDVGVSDDLDSEYFELVK